MRNGVILGWSLTGLAMLATPSFAQSAKVFDAQLSLEASRDDNVSRSNALVAARRGLVQEDTLTSPILSLNVVQPFGRQAVFLNGLAGYNFYEKNDRLNRERVSAKGGVSASIASCLTTLSGDYARKQSDLQDLEINVSENVATVTGVTLDASCGRQVGFAPSLVLRQEWYENSATIRSLADRAAQSVTAGVSYRRPTLGEVTLFSTYSDTTYDRYIPVLVAPASLTFERDGYKIYGGGLRYTRNIGSRLKGIVTVGYTSLSPYTSVGNEFKGVTYGADLTFKPSPRIEAQASFHRAVNPSTRIDTTYVIEELYSLQGTYSIGSRVKLGLGGSFTNRDYGRTPLAGAATITNEDVRSVFASIRFDLNRRLGFTVDARQQERNANVAGFDYTSNRVGLTVVAKY